MNARGIILGTLVSYAVTILALVICAALQYFGAIDAKTANAAAMCAAIFSAAAGGFVSARKSGSRKLFNSLAVCLMFVLLVAAASFAVNGSFAAHFRTIVLVCSAVGAGILGALFA